MYLLWSSLKTRLAACWQMEQRDGWHFRLAMKLIIRRICAKSRGFVFGLHFVILWSFQGAGVSTVGYCAGGLLWERSRVRFPGGSLKSLFRVLFFPCSFQNRVRTESWILGGEKVWKFAQQFSDLEKDWKMELMSGKMVKSLDIFFKATASASLVELFFVLGKSYAMSPLSLRRIMIIALFVPFLEVSIDNLFDNLDSGKRNYYFGKKVWKTSWILGLKICTNPASNLIPVKWSTYFGRGG